MRWSLFYCHLIASVKYEEIRQLNRKQACQPLVQNQSYIQHAYVRHDGVSSLHNGELCAGSFETGVYKKLGVFFGGLARVCR